MLIKTFFQFNINVNFSKYNEYKTYSIDKDDIMCVNMFY